MDDHLKGCMVDPKCKITLSGRKCGLTISLVFSLYFLVYHPHHLPKLLLCDLPISMDIYIFRTITSYRILQTLYTISGEIPSSNNIGAQTKASPKHHAKALQLISQ